jgi:fumarate reductase flavoprotein subunit
MAGSVDYDVIVIGAGLAGLAAGNRAAEFGLRVAVLEKSPEEHYLCNTRLTGGFFHVCRENMLSPPEEMRSRIHSATHGQTDPALADALVGDSRRALEWLIQQGVRFINAGPAGKKNNLLAPPSVRRPGLNNWKGRAGDVLLRTLEERLVAKGGVLVRGARATELVMKDGRCTGVMAMREGLTVRYDCGAVIIADGGFQADPEMVRRHLSPAPERVMQRNAGTGCGDGAAMAQAAGAALTGMNRFYGHLLYRGAMESDRFWPYPTLDFLASGAIVVDQRGERFVDEGHGGTHIANAVAALGDPLSAMVVFDAAIWNGPGRDYELPPNPHVVEAGAKLIEAATLQELAVKARLSPESLLRTVSEYNGKVAAGTAGELRPPRSSHLFKPWPISAPPFMAIELCAGLTYTMGGISTDAQGRVLRKDGTAIPGLFAAGCTTGGLEGGDFTGYTGGLSKASVFGLRAGEHAARAVKEAGATSTTQ